MNVRFALRHPREWLCDHGWLCKVHAAQRKSDMEALSEIADIVYDAKYPDLKLNVAGHDPLAQIERVLAAM